MSERTARALLLALLAGLCAAMLATDLPKLSKGSFWSDGATYHAMAWSLAEDGDVRYEARDVFRSRREFSQGPQGIFLKRVYGGWRLDFGMGWPFVHHLPDDEQRIYFAKSLAYPLAAAPLVKLFGTRGLLLLNALALWAAVAVAYAELRRHSPPGPALLCAVALLGGTVAPLYLIWLTPELFNLGLIALALHLWRRERPLLAALLLGYAVYSKPSNVFLALPLGLLPFVPASASWSALRERLLPGCRAGLKRAAVVAAATLALYGLNAALTGEANYQGGRERKTFYGQFPFETHGVTFGNSGVWMSTNQLGPSVQGGGADKTRGAEPARAAEEIRLSFLYNLAYFWVGRFGGSLWYFWPLAVAALLFVLRGPRSAAGGVALFTLLLSQVFYVWLIPDNWYGGSGTLGNRYFLNLLPLAVFLVPAGRALLVALVGLAGGAVLCGPLLASPVEQALDPGQHARREPFLRFPAELTMLNDLSVFGEVARKKQPFGDTEGDPRRPGSADPRAYYLYFPDDGTYFKESWNGREGFWLRGGRRAEVLLRGLEAAREIRVSVTGGPAGDEVTLDAGAGSRTVTLAAGEPREVALPPGRFFPYKETCVYVLKLRSQRGAPDARQRPEPNRLGAFVEIRLAG